MKNLKIPHTTKNPVKLEAYDLIIREKEGPCISILLNTHKLSRDRMQDPTRLKHALKKTKSLLKESYPEYAEMLAAKAEAIGGSIDFLHSENALGIYISPKIAQLIRFTFPVEESIHIGPDFRIRELLYDLQNVPEYYVLSVTQKSIRLYQACGKSLSEITDDRFPLIYTETYEYNEPSRGSSYGVNNVKEFEKDKSDLKLIRLKDLLKKADQGLRLYSAENRPLVVAGGAKETDAFMQITENGACIIGRAIGHYEPEGMLMLSEVVWQQVLANASRIKSEKLSELDEMLGRNTLASGLRKVWKAAMEGKGLELILEKDFEKEAILMGDSQAITYHQSNVADEGPVVKDTVERLLRVVLVRGGKVFFVENGELKPYGHVALRLRYPDASAAYL